MKNKHFFIVLTGFLGLALLFQRENLIFFIKLYQNQILIYKYQWCDAATIYTYSTPNNIHLKAAFFYPAPDQIPDKVHDQAPNQTATSAATPEPGSATSAELLPEKTISPTPAQTIQVPENEKKGKRPCMVYFFGGGYRNGSLNQFYKHAKYYRDRGYIAVLADYRVQDRHHTSPSQSMEDARALMKFLQAKADKLGIDTSSVFLCGASAGGQLALSTVFLHVNVKTDPIHSATQLFPKAILLYLPVVKTTLGGWGYQVMKREEAKTMSPLEHLHPQFPPILIFYGDKDETVKPENIVEFYRKANSMKIFVKLYPLKNTGHDFPEGVQLDSTLLKSYRFLQQLSHYKAHF